MFGFKVYRYFFHFGSSTLYTLYICSVREFENRQDHICWNSSYGKKVPRHSDPIVVFILKIFLLDSTWLFAVSFMCVNGNGFVVPTSFSIFISFLFILSLWVRFGFVWVSNCVQKCCWLCIDPDSEKRLFFPLHFCLHFAIPYSGSSSAYNYRMPFCNHNKKPNQPMIQILEIIFQRNENRFLFIEKQKQIAKLQVHRPVKHFQCVFFFSFLLLLPSIWSAYITKY